MNLFFFQWYYFLYRILFILSLYRIVGAALELNNLFCYLITTRYNYTEHHIPCTLQQVTKVKIYNYIYLCTTGFFLSSNIPKTKTKNQNRLYLFDSIYYCVSHVATRSILSLFLALFFFLSCQRQSGLTRMAGCTQTPYKFTQAPFQLILFVQNHNNAYIVGFILEKHNLRFWVGQWR